jgi:type IV pilus assembly protein PilP
MAKRSKKKDKNHFRNIVVILLVVCAAQAVFLFYTWSQEKVETVASAIQSAVAGVSDPVERERQKLRIAFLQYMVKNRKLPMDVELLVPEFLPEVPRNPKTGQEFVIVENGAAYEIAVSMDEARAYKAKHGGAIRGDTSDDDLIDVAAIKSSFSYNPSGKRDPFLPFGSDITQGPCGTTPIECTALVKLKLALVIDTGKEKRAMVETPDGRGYSVTIGSRIGNANGEVVDIKPDKVIVLEQSVDLAGKKNERFFELRLREDPEAVASDKAGGLSTIGRGYGPQK